ncbi:type II toxin-antitoxin system VapC family toxin [Halomonas sp. BM-2019]|uniref:type II toxin-antitoxin system VapC family toxin n=1 Tax=Halomonas sp. BM-2019 TaxID=2811227 RepID=UPI001B3C38ED|nr:MAG: type II toxin-antitoxin system VapC family toxin [Halomonas sp. BM-2019]
MFLLDTNVLSELRKAGDGKAEAKVTAWLAQEDAAKFYISAVTLLELEIGVLRVERRDPAQGARLHVPDPHAERDALIAATALIHGMSVVTRNVADFGATGVPFLAESVGVTPLRPRAQRRLFCPDVTITSPPSGNG